MATKKTTETAAGDKMDTAELARRAVELAQEVVNKSGAASIRLFGPRLQELKSAAAELLPEPQPADAPR